MTMKLDNGQTTARGSARNSYPSKSGGVFRKSAEVDQTLAKRFLQHYLRKVAESVRESVRTYVNSNDLQRGEVFRQAHNDLISGVDR